MPVTGETITDEQVIEVRDAAQADLDMEEQWWRDNARHAWSTQAQATHRERERAARETIAIAKSALNPMCHPPRRAEARQLMADRWNARHGGG